MPRNRNRRCLWAVSSCFARSRQSQSGKWLQEARPCGTGSCSQGLKIYVHIHISIGYCTFWGLYEIKSFSPTHKGLNMYNNLFNVQDYVSNYVSTPSHLPIQAILSAARPIWVYWPTCHIMKLNRLKIWKIRRSNWTKHNLEH